MFRNKELLKRRVTAMSEMDGCTVAKAVRALDRLDAGKVSIIAVAANAFA